MKTEPRKDTEIRGQNMERTSFSVYFRGSCFSLPGVAPRTMGVGSNLSLRPGTAMVGDGLWPFPPSPWGSPTTARGRPVGSRISARSSGSVRPTGTSAGHSQRGQQGAEDGKARGKAKKSVANRVHQKFPCGYRCQAMARENVGFRTSPGLLSRRVTPTVEPGGGRQLSDQTSAKSGPEP